MFGNPRYILLEAVCRYLDLTERNAFLDKLVKEKPKHDKKFIRIIQKHFDIARFKDDAVYPEDIWLYNYLQYEIDGRLHRKGLIMKYANKFKSPEQKDIFKASVAGL